jgi:hypothetical protein
MGQDDIQGFLKLHPAIWFTSKQLSEEVGVCANISRGSIIDNLKRMRKSKTVIWQTVATQRKCAYEYRYKGAVNET